MANPFFALPQTPTKAIWTWDTTNYPPKVLSYGNSAPTKTGLMPNDLQNFIGIPTIFNTNPPEPMDGTQLLGIIRQAEDWVEQNSGILLAKAWIASPPVSQASLAATNIIITSPSGNGQVYGTDFDIPDSGYDFYYRRFLMEGWGIQQLRYRPLKNIYYLSFIYPLLSEFFQIPLSWIVQDLDASFLRIVPSANVQMLPLFAMQLAFMGFAQSLPQALYFQYIAGLDALDYASKYAFMKTLVLSAAAVIVLGILQGTVNYGAIRQATSVDGLRYDTSYPSTGAAYGGLILTFKNQRDELLRTAIDLVRGAPAFFSL
jgi:hypothetical protein